MRVKATDHDWRYHNDGTAFLCIKCGSMYERTREKPFPPEKEQCRFRSKTDTYPYDLVGVIAERDWEKARADKAEAELAKYNTLIPSARSVSRGAVDAISPALSSPSGCPHCGEASRSLGAENPTIFRVTRQQGD